MFGKINPKQIEGMMRQMGIKQDNIDALRVIIEQEDKNIIINNPSVVKVNMSGQESFQISGEISEQEKGEQSEEETEKNNADIEMIMEKTGKSKEQVTRILEKNNGDIAETILELS